MSPEASPSARSKKSSAKPGSNRRACVHVYIRRHDGRIITHGWWEEALVNFIEKFADEWKCSNSQALERLLEKHQEHPKPAPIPVVPCCLYSPREMTRRVRRKTVRREEILHELGACIAGNDPDDGAVVVWQNRCLTQAIELLGGKVVAA